jgi:hypothetical protein
MKLRRIILIGLGVLLLVMIVALVWPARVPEPTVKGQPISVWLRKVPPTQVGEAAEAGTNAVPFLARAAQAHDTTLYRFKWWLWGLLPPALRARVQPPPPITLERMNALLALREFGPEAEPALGAVLQATQDEDVMDRSFALQAAVAINVNHPKVLALLKRNLQRTNQKVDCGETLGALYTLALFPHCLTNYIRLERGDPRHAFLDELLAMGALGSDIAPFVPRILPFLADSSTRGNALAALDRAGPGGAAAVPAVIECLRSPNSQVRRKAAEVLMGMGPAAKQALPVLEEVMHDKALATRVMAAAARARITGDPLPSVPVILAALETPDDGSTWFLPQGAFGLRSCGFNARQTALWFAGELGPATRDALLVLIRQMETGPDWQRVVAARAVWKAGSSPQDSLDVLRACLASKDEMPRILACYVLGEMGSAAIAAIPDLEKAERTTLATRRVARKAITAIRQKTLGTSNIQHPTTNIQ